MEEHWKFLVGGGGGVRVVLKAKILEAKIEAKLESLRGWGAQNKNLQYSPQYSGALLQK